MNFLIFYLSEKCKHKIKREYNYTCSRFKYCQDQKEIQLHQELNFKKQGDAVGVRLWVT